MIDVAEVKIWNHSVGAVLWNDSRQRATFEFEPGFLKLGYDLSPIKMPLEETVNGRRIYEFPELNYETFLGLPGMLSDSLPDKYGTRLVNRWLAEQGRDIGDITPVERLCFTGTRGMGALEYQPAIRLFDKKNKKIEVDRLVRLASEILSDRNRLKANMESLDREGLMDIIRVGTSAGGARAKAVIAYNASTGEIRSGQIDNLRDFEYWIIKLDGVTDNQLGDPMGYGKIEYAYYLMAVDCGINMAPCLLKLENNRAHFMSKRFDRERGDKIHMQSLCGMAHYDYNIPRGYSYEQAFQVIRLLKLQYTDTVELFRRACFNVIGRNQDDHTKNISFLMDKNGQWRLSPAYDMTYAFNPNTNWTGSHQMSINGKVSDITGDDLVRMAKTMNVKKPEVIIEEVRDIIANWPTYAERTGVDSPKIRVIQNTLQLDL